MSSSVWSQVMALKKNDDRCKGVANTLTDDEIETVIATVDFFGGDYRQDILDLRNFGRYRVFDWLAMRIQGRHSGSVHDVNATKVLAHSFIKSNGVTSAFIQDLRETDYDMDESYKELNLDEE